MMMMDARDLKDALALAAAKFRQAEGRLNELDGALGDGDHGITVRIVLYADKQYLDIFVGKD